MKTHIGNFRISISVYFAAIITFALIFSPDAGALTVLLSCIFHEAGHLAAIKIFGGKANGISLGAYGMRIDADYGMKLSPLKEAAVCAAGPAVNIILAVWGIICKNRFLVSVNISLAVINLIPAGKTDGYNGLYCLISALSDCNDPSPILKRISIVFIAAAYTAGIIIFLKSGFNFSLLAAAVYMTLLSLKE